MTRKEVCTATGLSIKTLRLYEEKGLIAPEFPYVDIARECFKRNLKMFSARRFISGCSDRKPNILNTV